MWQSYPQYRRHFPTACATACIRQRYNLTNITAVYGANCGVMTTSAAAQQATAGLRAKCAGRLPCDYLISREALVDAAPQCAKDFTLAYTCMPDPLPTDVRSLSVARYEKRMPAEAAGRKACPTEKRSGVGGGGWGWASQKGARAVGCRWRLRGGRGQWGSDWALRAPTSYTGHNY